MVQYSLWVQDEDESATPKWLNSPVVFRKGSLPEIREIIPTFERRDFVSNKLKNEATGINSHLDVIVRLPTPDDKTVIPIGVVSKNYMLVQHTEVFDVVTKSFASEKISLFDVEAEIKISEYGERMHLSLYFPQEYSFDPGDGNLMRLRFECVNSVEGSTRFRALMGWYRLVCGNGLVIGVTRSDLSSRHFGEFRLEDLSKVLRNGLSESKTEIINFTKWRNTKITLNQIESWVNHNVKDVFGFKAAARAYHIAMFGFDATIAGQYKEFTPSTITKQSTQQVPGAPRRCENLYDLSQILAWLAKERRDVQEQLDWREKIPDLLAPFLK